MQKWILLFRLLLLIFSWGFEIIFHTHVLVFPSRDIKRKAIIISVPLCLHFAILLSHHFPGFGSHGTQRGCKITRSREINLEKWVTKAKLNGKPCGKHFPIMNIQYSLDILDYNLSEIFLGRIINYDWVHFFYRRTFTCPLSME